MLNKINGDAVTNVSFPNHARGEKCVGACQSARPSGQASGAGSDICGVARYKTAESRNPHEPVFKESITQEAAQNSERHIYDIMMGSIDGRKPDPQGYYSQGHLYPCRTLGAQGVDECHQRIG